ncbi:MAG: flagellar motor switch protein FliN [Actinobacteria bacterium]|nr:flagellar motor switch protein FliN [Actinomycetota bacterium]
MMKQEEIKEFLSRMSGPDNIVRKVEYPSFDLPGPGDKMKVSINFIDDIQVIICAELGKTTMKIKDILKLGEGSVLELDQSAGETAEIYVNDQSFGKGEVVVIGGNFGIRMESILQTEKKEGIGKS